MCSSDLSFRGSGSVSLPTLDEGINAAQAEQNQRDDKTPEVAQLAVTQGMLFICSPRATSQTNVKENLITRVGDRMDGLCGHTPRIGVNRSDTFTDRDTKIGQKGVKMAFSGEPVCATEYPLLFSVRSLQA